MKLLNKLRQQRNQGKSLLTNEKKSAQIWGVSCLTCKVKDEHETMFEHKQHNEPENFGIHEGLHGRTC